MQAIARPKGGTLPRREPLDEDDQPRALWERAIGWGIVAVATWLVFCVLDSNHTWTIHPNHFRFGDLFLNTTTNGGDMGAHVWWPKFLADHWFSWNPFEMRLSGWAPDWYAGFPVGQYYFPLPALMVWVLDTVPFVPYNVAFKLVTVTGPLLLPAARVLLRPGGPCALAGTAGLRTRCPRHVDGDPRPVADLRRQHREHPRRRVLLHDRSRAGAVRTRRAGIHPRHRPATLAARRAHRGRGDVAHRRRVVHRHRRAACSGSPGVPSVPGVSRRGSAASRIAIPAVWLVPLLGNSAYTQSMRYTKLVPKGTFTTWSWLPLPGPVRSATNDFVRALGTYLDPVSHKHLKQPLWLPWWIWLLAAVAIVAAGWYRRRSTLILLVLALVMGVLFVQWPADFAVWNTRFLPFWLLTWGFLAAIGATEICRWVAQLVRWSYVWIRDGDLQDARARAWAEIATADDDSALDPSGAQERGVGTRRASLRRRPGRMAAAGAAFARAYEAAREVHRLDCARGRRRHRGNRRTESRMGRAHWRRPHDRDQRLGGVELLGLRVAIEAGGAAVLRPHCEHGRGRPHERQRAGVVGAVIGRARRHQQLRHEPRARAVAVFHPRAHRLDGGHLLRVLRDDLVPLPHGRRVLGASFQSGARAEVRQSVGATSISA